MTTEELNPATTAGAVRLACPDERCRYTITKGDRAEAEAAMAKHLAVDARHTGGSWRDLEGCERVGFDYVSAAGGRVER